MDAVYIKACKDAETDYFKVNLETLIVVFVYQFRGARNTALYVTVKDIENEEPLFSVNFSKINYVIVPYDSIPINAKYCLWPVVVVGNKTIAGLASVSRQILKSHDKKDLLGFREACLMACNEASVWTKFCEVDIISTVKNIISHPGNFIKNGYFFVPEDLIRFEHHMEQPVKIHNIYKLARIKNKNKSIKSNVPISELNLQHLFGEGPFMTLADILLFPCIQIIIQKLGRTIVENTLPLTISWFDNLSKQENILEFEFQLPDFFKETYINLMRFGNEVNTEISSKMQTSSELTGERDISGFEVIKKSVPKESLYMSDPKRYKPQARVFTKQNEVENVLSAINHSNLTITPSGCSYNSSAKLDWSIIPNEAMPSSGALPEKRAFRKTQQLENLVKAVLKVVGGRSCTIVDFCSGSGHLGILVATFLPSCKIILVENKEKSLQRAKERVEKIMLKNVILLQCNMDYFQADFDIGLALHACGVATDLVIQICIKHKADFICCPCCYGGIHNCHHMFYPRSLRFKLAGIKYEDFLIISHSADQTHDESNVKTSQGYFCMDIVDNDRKLYAEEHGYCVHLGKLQPPTCTPKNNLLVGILNKEYK